MKETLDKMNAFHPDDPGFKPLVSKHRLSAIFKLKPNEFNGDAL